VLPVAGIFGGSAGYANAIFWVAGRMSNYFITTLIQRRQRQQLACGTNGEDVDPIIKSPTTGGGRTIDQQHARTLRGVFARNS
jgi:hypothetical protein